MNLRKSLRVLVLVSFIILLIGFAAATGGHSALPGSPRASSVAGHCLQVGGSISTNLGAINQFTTLGTATGDLRGALAANILDVSVNGSTAIFTVQHHWVTESGDTLVIDQTQAVSTHVGSADSGLFAITDYPLHISDGTGRFAGATGDLHLIGEVHCFNIACSAGQTVFRYTGQIWFADVE